MRPAARSLRRDHGRRRNRFHQYPAQSWPALLTGAVLALLLVPAVAPQESGDAQQTRAKIEELEAEIARIAAEQRQRERRRDDLQGELRETEVSLGKLREALQRGERAIADNREQLAAGRARRDELQAAAARQQDAVAAELRQAWKGAGRDELKLLLNENDPQLVARMLAYYRYIVAARSATIEEYGRTVTALNEVQAELRRREAELTAQQERIERQRGELEQSRGERAQLLARIESRLDSEATLLAARRLDREQLEATLEAIEEALRQLLPEEDVQPFAEARGAMPWPLQGRLASRFGQSRNQGKMRWQGVRLLAEAGTTVAAIHHGRVVYADWLRGSGLLLVIDHGDGYMSLYAHNESLLREVGDWVSAGAPIATVGDSGGQSEAGLYFEIRKDGRPENPARWCRG